MPEVIGWGVLGDDLSHSFMLLLAGELAVLPGAVPLGQVLGGQVPQEPDLLRFAEGEQLLFEDG